ncbi:MAG: hypothetical protein WGN25_18635 [Candidatus Electrothrix sp. GW3-4]|uniref:hypothetical protein n=1 Tax=Candidatus Electrothrix sp. GW3-4 TaxID=3126740 RepID=UPI0030D53128
MHDILQELKTRLQEINDLGSATSLLHWDQATYMPPKGAAARARQLATLSRLSQEKFVDPAIGKLLDQLEPWAEEQPYDTDDASLIRVVRRDYEEAIKIPTAFMAEFSEHSALSYQAWAKARPENDFASLQPILEKTLDYSRQLADFFPGYEHIADPLIDFADYGMKASDVRVLFGELRQQLSPIVQAISEQAPADDACLRQVFPEAEQLQFSEEVVRQLGYDFQRGRMDKTHHPFMTKFSLGDVRITTRVKEEFLGECLYSVIHEGGHAMYEQGIRREFEGLPLASGTGMGVHESQPLDKTQRTEYNQHRQRKTNPVGDQKQGINYENPDLRYTRSSPERSKDPQNPPKKRSEAGACTSALPGTDDLLCQCAPHG